MTDYSEHGAVPVEDAVVDDPPTVDEVLERQRREHPEQARTSMGRGTLSDAERSALDAGGERVVGADGRVEIEGPNPA